MASKRGKRMNFAKKKKEEMCRLLVGRKHRRNAEKATVILDLICPCSRYKRTTSAWGLCPPRTGSSPFVYGAFVY